MSALDLSLIKDLGLGGIALFTLIMIARGALVPRKTVDALLAEKQKAIEFLRAGVDQREAALKETIPLVRASVEHQETIVKLVTGMTSALDKLVTDKEAGR